jgi:hypothetical protein
MFWHSRSNRYKHVGYKTLSRNFQTCDIMYKSSKVQFKVNVFLSRSRLLLSPRHFPDRDSLLCGIRSALNSSIEISPAIRALLGPSSTVVNSNSIQKKFCSKLVTTRSDQPCQLRSSTMNWILMPKFIKRCLNRFLASYLSSGAPPAPAPLCFKFGYEPKIE